MLKKIIIPVVILAIALGAYRMMNAPKENSYGGRPATPVSAPSPESSEPKAKPGADARKTDAVTSETRGGIRVFWQPRPGARWGIRVFFFMFLSRPTQPFQICLNFKIR